MGIPEVAWPGSSGGFSRYFPRPYYQDAAVEEYLEKVLPETFQYYSRFTDWNGRGFPDVSAQSLNYLTVLNGSLFPIGGTSAAAPVWAGIVALLNDALIRAGKPVLGWLNPLIYAFGPEVLNDITSGSSIGCNGNNSQTDQAEPRGAGIVPGARWNATTAWDPITGYGTPDFEKLKDLVLRLSLQSPN
jgi:tripeptidyl-peptidase-1